MSLNNNEPFHEIDEDRKRRWVEGLDAERRAAIRQRWMKTKN